MGIQGLLPLLKSIHKPTHLRTFSGQTLGVDAYGWLHRGAVACAVELAEGRPTRKYIDFALHRVRMLTHFGVKPYIVFDGDYLPSKAHTEQGRATRRKESKRLGLELLRMGRSSQAQLELQKAVDVTPTMARELIEELKRLDVPYVVAPYEADSQLAYLEKKGIIHGVVSEDSDLLVFGVSCLLTKLDQYGECVMINRANFTACRDISLVGWGDKEFRMMAMLSGCDYLPGIDGMGLKTAYRLVRKHKSIERVVRTMQFDGKMKVPPGYLEEFRKAEHTFLYQWVFCPEARRMLNLTTLPANMEVSGLPYIGQYVDPEIAGAVACGDLDPNTKQPIVLPDRFAHRARQFQRVVQTPDEKQGKPITEFFRKRTPLAELDPNSFTPTGSQQNLLEIHRNTSWSATQASAQRAPGQTRSSGIPVPSSAPPASRRAATDPSPPARITSPKRQRLCRSPSLAAVMKGTEDMQAATSQFFAKSTSEHVPATRRKPFRNRKDEFELWSDDSVAEAVAAATAVSVSTPHATLSSPRKRRKPQVFADKSLTGEGSSVGDISQDSIATSVTEVSEENDAAETPDTSFESITTPEQHSTVNRGIKANLAALRWRNKASSRASPLQMKSPPFLTDTPPTNTQRTTDPSNEAGEQSPSRDTSGVEVPNTSPAVGDSSFVSVPNEAGDDIIDDEQFINMEQRPVFDQPADCIKGSEDLLVPESPEAPNNCGTISKLNLGRFAFAG